MTAPEPAVMYLVKSTGRISHHRFRLDDPVYTFGSDPSCDIIIKRDGVAPFHAKVNCVAPGQYEVERLATGVAFEVRLQRGTHKWLVQRAERLQHRDLITIAKRRFFFTAATVAPSQSVDAAVAFSQMSLDNHAPVAAAPPVAVQLQPPKPVVVVRRRSITPIPDVAEVVVVADDPPPQPSLRRSETSDDFVKRATPPAPLSRSPRRSSTPVRSVAPPVIVAAAAAAAAATPAVRVLQPSPIALPSAVPDAPPKAAADRLLPPAAVAKPKKERAAEPAKAAPAKRASKSSQSKGPLVKFRVLLSHAASDRWINMLKDLGAEVINGETIEMLPVRPGDIFVACIKRTENMVPKASFKLLLALALDAPIVSFDWILACHAQRALLDVAPYVFSMREVIDVDAPPRQPRMPSLDGRRIELIGGSETERKQLSLVLERARLQVIKADSRVLGQYKLTAAISFGGARALQRAQEMRAHGYTVVGIKWLKHCLCAGGFIDPLSSPSFAADDAPATSPKPLYVYDDTFFGLDDERPKRKAAPPKRHDNDDNDDDGDDSGGEAPVPLSRPKRKAAPKLALDDSDDDDEIVVDAKPAAKRSRVIESVADDDDDVEEEEEEEEEEELDIVDEPSSPPPPPPANDHAEKDDVVIDETSQVDIVNDDIVASADKPLSKISSITSRSAVVNSSPTMSPPAPDNADLSLSFDDIRNTQLHATQAPPEHVATPLSSPDAKAARLLRPVEPVESAHLDDSSDRAPSTNAAAAAAAPILPNDLSSVVAEPKHTALAIWQLDRNFELQQMQQEERENAPSKATQYV